MNDRFFSQLRSWCQHKHCNASKPWCSAFNVLVFRFSTWADFDTLLNDLVAIWGYFILPQSVPILLQKLAWQWFGWTYLYNPITKWPNWPFILNYIIIKIVENSKGKIFSWKSSPLYCKVLLYISIYLEIIFEEKIFLFLEKD